MLLDKFVLNIASWEKFQKAFCKKEIFLLLLTSAAF